MIKNANILRRFEREELKKERLSFAEKLKLLDSMWKEACSLGAIKTTKGLGDLEKAIRIAKGVNGL